MKHLITLFILLCLAYAAKAQQSDLALWNTLNLEWKTSKKGNLHLTNQYRFNENISRFDYTFYDIGYDRRFKKWLSGTAAYVLNVKNDIDEGVLYRHQFYMNASLEWSPGKWKFQNRNQVQTQIEDQNFGGDQGFPDLFYRNKMVVRYKLSKKWYPYIAAELYFRINHPRAFEDYVYRTRAFAAVQYNISKRRSAEAYYMYQNQSTRTGPAIIHVIGVRFNYTFKQRKEKDEEAGSGNDASGAE